MDQQISSGIGVLELMKDMGDGTHARVVYASPGAGASSVSVTNFPATQPVSGTVAVTGVATSALQTALNTALGPATARAAVIDPTLAADVNQLLRGILTALNAQTVLLQTIATNTTPP